MFVFVCSIGFSGVCSNASAVAPKSQLSRATACAHAAEGPKREQLFTSLADAAEQRMNDFNSQDLANTAWAVATVGRKHKRLFISLADAAKQRMKDFKLQGLVNTAWAFATVDCKDTQLFTALADAAEQRMKNCNSQNLASTVWALTDSVACALESCRREALGGAGRMGR